MITTPNDYLDRGLSFTVKSVVLVISQRQPFLCYSKSSNHISAYLLNLVGCNINKNCFKIQLPLLNISIGMKHQVTQLGVLYINSI